MSKSGPRMSRRGRSRATLMGCALLLCCRALPAEPGISVKGSPVQGNPLFVTAEGPPDVEVEAIWGGQRFALGKSDHEGALRAVLAVPVDLKTGPQKLVVRFSEPVSPLKGTEGGPESPPGSGLEFSKSISVTARHFPQQNLSINPSTLASYDNPQNKADDEAILRAIKKNDPVLRWKGSFHYPVEAPETTGFGQKRLYNGWRKGWHKGLDLGGWEGQPVKAPAAGRVVHVARGLVNGNTVVLSHGCGLGTVYMHLQSSNVEPGQEVKGGQVIGRVGGTGGFSPHLHWEARVWGVPIDPKSLFQMPSGWR